MTEEELRQFELLVQRVTDLEGIIGKNNYSVSAITFIKNIFFRGIVSIGLAQTKIGMYGTAPTSQAAAIAAPTTPGATYAQAEAQSAVNKINEIRTALKNIGITL